MWRTLARTLSARWTGPVQAVTSRPNRDCSGQENELSPRLAVGLIVLANSQMRRLSHLRARLRTIARRLSMDQRKSLSVDRTPVSSLSAKLILMLARRTALCYGCTQVWGLC